ncbi:MAG: DNA-processing protein DprA [Anaerolineales bacterium]
MSRFQTDFREIGDFRTVQTIARRELLGPIAAPAASPPVVPERLTVQGDQRIWDDRRPGRTLALFCSTKVPASLLLQLHDLAQRWRHSDRLVVSGFHAPAERECLQVLLRGPASVIWCPARGLARMRLKADHRAALEAGRLLILSPFSDSVRRATVATAAQRNRFVAALADTVLIAHAQAGSKTEALAQEALRWGKPLYTLPSEYNSNLIALGASGYAEREGA